MKPFILILLFAGSCVLPYWDAHAPREIRQDVYPLVVRAIDPDVVDGRPLPRVTVQDVGLHPWQICEVLPAGDWDCASLCDPDRVADLLIGPGMSGQSLTHCTLITGQHPWVLVER
jgi:hypothetical protein